jgi:hypothetical protein
MKIDEDEKTTKIDDDFLKIPLHQWNVQEKNREKCGTSKIREFLPYLSPVSLVLIILVAIATGYLWMQVSALSTGIKSVNAVIGTMDVGSLKSRLAIAETALEQINKENGHLKSELAKLSNEVDVMKAKREKAEAAASKQPPTKKKAAGGMGRTR